MFPALGTFLGGIMVARIGWRAFFIVLGVGFFAGAILYAYACDRL